MTEPNKDNPPAPPAPAPAAPAAAAPAPPAPAPAAPAAAAPAPAPPAPAKVVAKSKIEITGTRGGPLAIYGENLGKPGQLIVNSREIKTSAWYTDEKSHLTTIKAMLPDDVGSGPVQIKSGDGQVFEGYLGAK